MVRNLAISMNNILQIIEDKCVDAGGDKHIDPQHLDVFKEETDYLEGRLGLSPFQSILLATIIQNDNRCSISKVGGMLGMTYLRALSYSADFYKLRDQGYIRLSPDNEIKTTPAALMAIMNDKPIEKPKTEGLSTQTIFRRLAEMMKLNSRGQETDNHILEEMDLLIGANPQSGLASACLRRLYVPGIAVLTAKILNPISQMKIHARSLSAVLMKDHWVWLKLDYWFQLNKEDCWPKAVILLRKKSKKSFSLN